MASESYTDSVRLSLLENAERLKKTREAIRMIQRIIGHHTKPHDAETVAAYWDVDSPEELVWLALTDKNNRALDESEFAAHSEKEWLSIVSKANFVFSTEKIPPTTVFSIDLDRDRIEGRDGELLAPPQVDGVIVDLERYVAAIADGRVDRAG